ncbi:hypothetical protein Cgig2_023476 [Carnegiea gigantea]|uniref:DUF4283 domain-containing protein n=1 Tax=Carnegiea gigantea TaxID=171969 RepID=A0A9Q1JHM3_9CARY|nr:hypothetical protein Cgig2_023476 [Carnegiea gigantea]
MLKFIPALIINGVKCAKIEKTNTAPEINYWQSAVLCTVLGANPPLEIIEGFVRRIWAAYEIDKVCRVRAGLYLVRFQNQREQIETTRKGFYYFDKKPFLVQFLGLDIKYWGVDSLGKIGSIIGIPIKMDKYTIEKTMLRFSRVMIDIPLGNDFLDYVEFANDHNVIVRQSVTYEWRPIKCTHYRMYGHMEDSCRKKTPAKKVWRVVSHSSPAPTTHAPISTDLEQEPPEAAGISGLNWPNKQDDVNIFLQLHKINMIETTACPKAQPVFQFCDMWIRDPKFLPLIKSLMPMKVHHPWQQLRSFMRRAQQALSKLNKDKYHDLRAQLELAGATLEQTQQELMAKPTCVDLLQKEKDQRQHYITIGTSVTDILRQQSKATEISYGDGCNRFFFAKVKQRKIETYVYELQD